jgi:hypothetical protein
MVAPILARKAEMADAVARTKAMQSASAPPTSVMEQLMQRTAEQEQPEPQAREIGVAQLPVREGMYDEQRMAGGGIVAFDEGGGVSFAEGSETDKRILDYLKGLPRSVVEKFREFNQPYSQVKPFQGTQAEFDAMVQLGRMPKTEAGIATLGPKTPDSQYVEQDKNAYASKIVSPITRTAEATAPTKAPTVTKAPDAKTQSPLQKATGAPVMPETKVDPIDALLAKYEKMIAGDPEATKKAKKDAMWNRLAEAGLNIMGGTSSNFAQNVALASPAIRGYGEDVKGIRAEETAKLNQLAGLGLKGAGLKQEARKLGITEQHYKDWLKVQEQQIGERREDRKEMAATRLEGVKSREDIAMDNRIKGFADSLLKLPKYMDNPELAYADAKKMITGQGGAAPVMTYNPQTRTFK